MVYFSENKNKLFKINDLKTKVTIKDTGLDVLTCYCFNHTRKSILDEIERTGKSTIIENIKKKMQDPGCFCEISNPQGICCLSNNISYVKNSLSRRPRL